jgi:hypothetical protein
LEGGRDGRDGRRKGESECARDQGRKEARVGGTGREGGKEGWSE